MSTFNTIVNDAISKVPKKPRGRFQNDAIDAINRASATAENAFSDVKSVLEGNSSARQQREVEAGDVCDTVMSGNTLPSIDKDSLVVTLSPLSWGQGNNQATNPINTVLGDFASTGYILGAQYNPQRTRLMIVNTGSGSLFVIFGKAAQYGANVTTLFHLVIPEGEVYIDDSWQGRVDIASDTGSSFSLIEFSRALNVSQ
jgi:hypothetical protein